MKRLLGLPPFLFVSLCCAAYGLFRPPFTLPILLFILPTLSVNLLLEESNALFAPTGLALSSGVFFLLSSNLALLHLHGHIPAMTLIILLAGGNLAHIWVRRGRFRTAIQYAAEASRNSNILPNAVLFAAFLAYSIYSLKFWVTVPDNALHAHFLESAQYILERGRYFIMSPAKDSRTRWDFWYPNFNAHLNVWGSSFLNWNHAVRFSAALGSVLAWSGCAVLLLFLIEDAQLDVGASVAIFMASLCSYSVFKIGPELSTDTPLLLFVPAWLHYVSLALKKGSPRHLWAAFATAFLCFSMRFHAGFILSAASVTSVFLLPKGRQILSQVAHPKTFKFIAPLALILLGSVHWYLIAYLKTGNPFHPFQSHNERFQFHTRPEYLANPNWKKQTEGPTTTTGFKPLNADPKEFILYHFFAVSQDSLQNRQWGKIARGILHGFTFSSSLTLLALSGLFIVPWKTAPENTLPSVLLITTLILFIGLAGKYYKFLYVIYPAVVYLAAKTLCHFQKRLFPALSSFLTVLFAGVFALSFLMTGFGSEADRWTVLKALKTPRGQIPAVKAYEWLELARQLQPSLQPGDRILSFHIEPGYQLNFYLHNGYYFEDYDYSSQETEGLHQARTEDEVLAWLKERHVRWIVDTYPPDRDEFLNTPDPDLLPKMLVAHSPKLKALGCGVFTPNS